MNSENQPFPDPLEVARASDRARVPSDAGLSLLDLMIILLGRKWFIAIGLLVISAGAVTYTLLAKQYFTATTTLLPNNESFSNPLGSILGDLPIGGILKGMDFLGSKDDTRLYSILESRRLADIVIERYDLYHRYEFHEKRKFYYEDLLKKYHKAVSIEGDKYENLLISVTDTNPEFAAHMAKGVVEILDSLAYEVNRESAKGSRLFFESRLDLMQHTLDSVHQEFAAFQAKHRLIDLEAQVKSSIDALAKLEAEGIAADLEKEILESTFGSNSKIAEAKKRKKVIDDRLQEYMSEGGSALVLPLGKTPELGIQYMYLYRNVKIQEALYAFLMQMYEQAKFQEANNAPAVTVLEPAKVPTKRTRPKRSVICILAFLAGFVVLSGLVLAEHWYREHRAADSSTYRKLLLARSKLSGRK